MPLRPWPANDEPALASDIVTAVTRVLRQGYRLVRRPRARLKYNGFEVGQKALATGSSAEDMFTEDSLAYHAERGRKLLDVACYLLFQLGVEQGRRMTMQDEGGKQSHYRLEGYMEGYLMGAAEQRDLTDDRRAAFEKRLAHFRKVIGFDPVEKEAKHAAELRKAGR